MRLSHLFMLTGLALSPEVSMAVNCSVSNVQPVNFGTVNPLSAAGATTTMTFNYSCSRTVAEALSGVTLCFNIGASAVSGQINSRQMSFLGPPASILNYQLYQDPGYSKVWGSQYQSGTTQPMVKITLLNLLPVTGSMTVYARIPGPQITASPGSYKDNYSATTASITLNTGALLPPTTCGTTVGPTFPISVLATVAKQCNVSFANNINLGTVNATQTNISANNTIGITCTNSTPYTIGLVPSNGNTAGSGVMKTSNTNTDQVPYQLRSGPGIGGTPWGNTSLNSVAGTGTGSTTAWTVYVTAPGANYTPDSYADTVTMNVTY